MENKPTEYCQADAAKFLHVTPQRVLQWRQNGSLIGFIVGRRWFVKAEEIEAFAAQPRRKPGRPRKNFTERPKKHIPIDEQEDVPPVEIRNEYLKEEYG